MATTSRYYDGDYAVGFYDGPPLITYPFLNNTTPDRYAKQIRRTWLQRGVDYVPTNADRTSYTNLIQYSEQFENVIWTKNQLTVSENQTTNPYDGALSVDAIYETATTDVHFVYQPYTFAAATYTVSVIAKANGRNWLYINTPMASAAFFNLSTGVVGTIISATSAEMIPLGNGFYRCSLTFTAASGADFVRYYVSTDGSTISYAGDITKGLYLWGSELKQSSSAGPYVSTTNATRTVSAPNMDPGDEINEADPFAYLVAEAEQNRDIADTVKVSRLFSRIPATQTRPTSLRISKPSISGSFPQVFSDYRIFQPDSTLAKFDAYRATAVTSDSGIPSFYPTGGTYTLTFDGDTTGAIPYNHNAAQVETELDALASVTARGGVTVTGSYNSASGFTVAFNAYAAATLSTGSLTSSRGFAAQCVALNNGYSQAVQIASTVDAPATTGNVSAITGPYYAIGFSTSYDASWQSTSCLIYTSNPYTPNEITGGTFTLTIDGNTSGPIAYNARATDVVSALNLIGSGAFECIADGTAGTILNSIGSQILFRIRRSGQITGGTFTITVGANTTGAIAYNATTATIQTALNALTSVSDRGGVTVTGTGLSPDSASIAFSFDYANPIITANSASLTPASSIAISSNALGYSQQLAFASSSANRTIYAQSHGITTQGYIFLKYNSSSYISGITAFTVIDSNTIKLTANAGNTAGTASSISEVGPLTKSNYAPGSGTIAASAVTSFYLPGVTAGITTAADIPQVSDQGDQTPFLLATFAGTGTINMNVGQLQPWNGTTILSQEITTINAADV